MLISFSLEIVFFNNKMKEHSHKTFMMKLRVFFQIIFPKLLTKVSEFVEELVGLAGV